MMDWQEFPWGEERSARERDQLCTETAGGELDCVIEGDTFVRESARLQDEIVICAYNVERGHRLDAQLRALTNDPGMPSPDVLLISEADRYCSRTENRNVAREYARSLGMCYVYGVEFVELPRFWGPGGPVRHRCEHGNAIISRYPLGNVRMIRHRTARSWNSSWQRILRIGEPRLGGRMAISADVRMGEKLLRVYAVHFESGSRSDGGHTADVYREGQVKELIEDASGVPHGVVIGGDMNTGRYLNRLRAGPSAEPVTDALFDAGYEDAHSFLPASHRATSTSHVAIDLIFGRGVAVSDSGIGPTHVWGGLSNHLPVWTRVRIGAPQVGR